MVYLNKETSCLLESPFTEPTSSDASRHNINRELLYFSFRLSGRRDCKTKLRLINQLSPTYSATGNKNTGNLITNILGFEEDELLMQTKQAIMRMSTF